MVAGNLILEPDVDKVDYILQRPGSGSRGLGFRVLTEIHMEKKRQATRARV